MAIVTLLTDFGLADTYVGQVKGVILGVCPTARIVDLTHAVPPQDVRAGAFLLWTGVEAFPAGAIHLAVVDPGVGTARRAVAAQAARGDLLVGPDNGLLVPAVDRLGGLVAAVELSRPEVWRANASATFHGRDVFAPVAGHLAAGKQLEELGEPVPDLARPFELEQPRQDGRRLHGTVLYVDTYGNLITNLGGSILPLHFSVTIRDRTIQPAPHPHYQAVPPGSLLALVGSSGLLEVSTRDGSAAATLGARPGDPVLVVPA